MNLKRYAVFVSLGTIAMAGLAIQAHAQNYRGTFNLPVEAHWGNAVLPPGDYTVKTDIVASTPVLVLTGNGVSASILAGPITRIEPSDSKGQLELTEVNGTYAVTKLVAAVAGHEYRFPIPKKLGATRAVASSGAKIEVWSHQ